MQKAGGIVGLIAGIFGALTSLAMLFFVVVGHAAETPGAQADVRLAMRGLIFSFLAIILGAVTISAKSKIPGALLVLTSIAGAVLGGILVAIFMVPAFIGGILAMIGTKKTDAVTVR